MLFRQVCRFLFAVIILSATLLNIVSPSEANAQGFELGYGYTAGPSQTPTLGMVRQQSNFPNDLADIANTSQFSVWDYRRMFRDGVTPLPQDLAGQWQGVNKGIVEIAGYKQFVKDIRPSIGGQLHGDNIMVQQVDPTSVRRTGWHPDFDRRGNLQRQGKFAVQAPSGRGFFGQAARLSYADGDNPASDPSRLLIDHVVRINEHQLLGRAAAKFGPVQIPLSYFVLERVPGGVRTIPTNLPTGF